MAVYNTENFLQEAIESVLMQTYNNWELICVNDGSNDNSWNILKTYENLDKRIVILNQAHSGSASCARNTGLTVSRGDFIAMLDSDDKIEPNYLNKLIDRYKETKADIVLASTEFWNDFNNSITGSICGIEGDIISVISGRESFLLSLNWKIGGIGICRSSLLKSIGYDTKGMNGDEYTTRLLYLKAHYVAFCDAKYYYRNNQSSTTKKFSIKYFDVHETQYRIYELIKANDFEDHIIKYRKEDLIKSLVHDYRIYFDKKKQLSFSERLRAKNILKANAKKLHHELTQTPKLDNKLKNIIYSFILSNSKCTYTFSYLWRVKNKVTFLFKIQ
jgi:glycosyltransferase involved in cell wall biosynthesis